MPRTRPTIASSAPWRRISRRIFTREAPRAVRTPSSGKGWDATLLYADVDGFHFMDQENFETLTLKWHIVGDDAQLLVRNVLVQIQKYNGNPIGVQFPPHVELTVASTEPGVRGDTASGGVTKLARLETGLEIRVPLFIKEGERVKVHTETREFAGRA